MNNRICHRNSRSSYVPVFQESSREAADLYIVAPKKLIGEEMGQKNELLRASGESSLDYPSSTAGVGHLGMIITIIFT